MCLCSFILVLETWWRGFQWGHSLKETIIWTFAIIRKNVILLYICKVIPHFVCWKMWDIKFLKFRFLMVFSSFWKQRIVCGWQGVSQNIKTNNMMWRWFPGWNKLWRFPQDNTNTYLLYRRCFAISHCFLICFYFIIYQSTLPNLLLSNCRVKC